MMMNEMALLMDICQVFSLVEFISKYWYSNFASFVMGFLGFYGALKVKNEFIFVV
jgi:maltodextrin utilization protein YvdJ